jgi:hypothetical protein
MISVESLPLTIAGPMLRRTESHAVTVWLALKSPERLCLKIYSTVGGRGENLESVLLEGDRYTVRLSQNLHVVAVTAKPIGDKCLQPGQIYAYDLYFESAGINLIDATTTTKFNCNLSYFAHGLPTFSLPPSNLNYLKLVHGSCRKPHGGGRDALSCLDGLIAEAADLPDERPHQLFLTGDQIYGDDVADPMLWLTQEVGKLLFGWDEELPLLEGTILSGDLAPGQRTEIARIEGGLTGMLDGKSDKAKSHLFSFTEYASAYLIAWSPLLIPKNLPSGRSRFRNPQQIKNWDREIDDIKGFFASLSAVRRAMANVPVYTICDDHEISDDWYLNREWCDRVLSKPLGRRIVNNGLLAYCLFQAWGNTPEQFAENTPGEKLLKLAAKLLASEGRDTSIRSRCDRFLGIPPVDNRTGLPEYTSDRDVLRLAREPQAIDWHYTILGSSHEVIVLDTRNWRGYPAGEEAKLEPPMLLSPTAFEQQLNLPLQQAGSNIEATILVLPTNLVALKIIDRIQQWSLSRNRVFSTDAGDSWNFHQEAFIELILNISRQRDRVIILSGDIHYSCAVRLTYWDITSSSASVLAQLTSSAIKNSELVTRLIHTKLKFLLPEPIEYWVGWNEPRKTARMQQPSFWSKIFRRSNPDIPSPPDWQSRIEWCKRQPAKTLPWQPLKPSSKPQLNLWQKFTRTCISGLWRNRWLQEGSEVIGKNNLSLVKFQWSDTKAVIQETYWYPPWNDTKMVKSNYVVSLEPETRKH